MKPLFLASCILLSSISVCAKPLVIAHRGASGYLPEHSFSAKTAAVVMGADYIEQDLVMTKDNELVVIHDLYLNNLSNVVEVFPNRNRNDGKYYVIDFTLAELQQLKFYEVTKTSEGKVSARYPSRFPQYSVGFAIHTFQQEIELIQGLNKTLNKEVGLYPEVKSPWFHQQEGKDIAKAVLQVLKNNGYDKKNSKVFLQSFDANELKRIKFELLPQLNMNIKLVQLIAYTDWNETQELKNGKWQNYDYSWMFSDSGITQIAQYADGIGPWYPMLVGSALSGELQKPLTSSIVLTTAKREKLAVHPYTFRKDEGQVPNLFNDFEAMLAFYLKELKVDGVFTDFPDLVVEYIAQ